MLTAKNISKNFGEIKVLDNINLNVEKGSIVSIYGSSGAGKSTLLYILSTLDKPVKGLLLWFVIHAAVFVFSHFRLPKTICWR